MFDKSDIFQIVIFFFLLIGLTPVLGNYLYLVYTGKRHFLRPILGWVERLVYKFAGICPEEESNWKVYLKGLLMLNFLGFIFLLLIQIFQCYLPLNPEHLGNISWHSAFNTSISFITNTNWQGYTGEKTISYFVQMLGLSVQNFLSAATGISVLLVLIRGISRKTTSEIGNFWVDITRSVIYVLLPLSVLLAIVLVGEGVVQNFHAYQTVQTLEGSEQIIPMGPAASQIAIKQLGTNGGGFFGANSAHPFENPTPFSNMLEMLAILIIPSALTYMYGKMTGFLKHGWTLFITMLFLFSLGLFISLHSEFSAGIISGNPSLMEGKEVRFGITNSILWSTTTTAASNGSVNAMMDSLSPLSGMVGMVNIMLGEVIFGGVGSGLYGMVLYVILTVFIAGLMVGRTPEYLGKKIDAFEVKMALIAVLAPSFVILTFSALASLFGEGLSALNNTGPHGFSEILYAFSSTAGNNGSAFAGLNSNTVFYNITLGISMLIGRFGVIIPVMAISGNMASKKITPDSAGTFKTDNWLFIGLLIMVILIIGGLTFFPALSLGPIVDHLMLINGVNF